MEKRINKYLAVPTLALCTLGWACFTVNAIEHSKEMENKAETRLNSEELFYDRMVTPYEQFIEEYERVKAENERQARIKEEEEKRQLERDMIRQQELERQRIIKERHELEQKRMAEIQRKKEEEKKKTSNVTGESGQWINAQFTHYTAFCPEGCTGVTASGEYVGDKQFYKGYQIVAATKSIPLYTIIEMVYPDGKAVKGIVLDRGGAISHKGILDVLVSTESKARQLGRQNGKYRIIGKLK